MSNRVKRKFPAILMAIAFVFGPMLIWACSVPVFRYALDLWPPDDNEVVLFSNGPLNAEQKKLLEKIRPLETENASVPNIRIHEVNLKAEPDPRWSKWWDKNKPADTSKPWLAVFYPASTLKIKPLWAGAFSEESVKKAFHSPARQTVAKRLQAGDSAVWVLVECGNKEKDQAARKLLDERLKHLGETLEMPDLKPQDLQAGYLSIRPEDLKLGFSVITVAVDDPAEAVFREILLNSEDDLKDYNEPITFPVFGRGRALPALVGKGINNDMIDEASIFLSGPCSCQVKRQNPGFDLLTSVNWDQLLEDQINELDDKAQMKVTTETKPNQTTENPSPNPAPADPAPTPNPTSPDPAPTPTSKGKSTPANPPTPAPAENPPATRSLLAWIPLAGIPILLAGGLILLLGRRRDS